MPFEILQDSENIVDSIAKFIHKLIQASDSDTVEKGKYFDNRKKWSEKTDFRASGIIQNFYIWGFVPNGRGSTGKEVLRHTIHLGYTLNGKTRDLLEIAIPLEYKSGVGRVKGRIAKSIRARNRYILRNTDGFTTSGRISIKEQIEEELKENIIDINNKPWIKICDIDDFNLGSVLSILRTVKAIRDEIDTSNSFREAAENLIEANSPKKGGQGFIINAELKKEIENHAVTEAIKYFESLDYSVENVGNKRPYDLECKKKKDILRVEVKGTQTKGERIILTPNEVANARKYRTALYILHSISVEQKGKKYILEGGEQIIRDPWKIDDDGELKELSYMYYISK